VTELASLARYEDFMRAFVRIDDGSSAGARATPDAQEEATLAYVAAANGIEILGVPGAVPPAA
jgi:hypothetical protein